MAVVGHARVKGGLLTILPSAHFPSPGTAHSVSQLWANCLLPIERTIQEGGEGGGGRMKCFAEIPCRLDCNVSSNCKGRHTDRETEDTLTDSA